jgi:subtilase family serine protease
MLLFLFSSLTPLQEMEELEHDFDSSMSAGGRSSPDLIVDYISASWSSADAGDSKSVSVRIENQGDASSGSFRWGLYLSTDTSITTSDTHLDDWSQSSISSGSSRSTSKSITIPTTITGARYYVGMIVDINNQVSESDENNNDDYDSGRVTINEAPDLTGRSCSTPSTGVVGDYLDSSISLSIENDPGGSYIASSGAFDWGMFLSSDSTITTSDTQVGSDQYKSSISGGSYSSDTLSSSNRIPSSLSGGTYHWGFIVDINSDVDEQDETNNIYYCGQITIEDDDADLEADSVGTSSSSAVMGDTITVSYRINNIGHDYSGSFHWELYLSTDQTITTNDVLVDEFSVSSISANNYRSGYEYNVQIPTTITAGYYYLGMIADNRDAVDELDETNNVAYDSTRIDIEEQADLEATTLSGPSTGQAGQQVSISWKIENNGDDSTGTFYWRMYLSSDSTITSSDTQVGSQQYASNIYGGSSRSGTFNDYIPSSLGAGTYYWGIIVDTTSVVDEGDETNNVLTGNSISLTEPDYDLEATSITVDSNYRQVCEGEDIYLTLSVTNLGNDHAGFHQYEATVATSGTDTAIYYGTSLGTASGNSGVPSYTHSSMRASLPTSLTPGTYYVGIIVDVWDSVDETDETNNVVATQSAELTILDCAPDVEATSISGPSSGVRGQSLQVTAQVKNDGLEDAVNVGYEILFSQDASITRQDVLVASGNINSILMGAMWTDSVTISVPSNLADGCWYWGLIVDPTDSIIEMDETDNSLASTAQFCLQQADLVVSSISSSDEIMSGQSVEIDISIDNAGGSNANGFTVLLMLSDDTQLSNDDIELDSFVVGPLLNGNSTTISRSVTIPGQQIGTRYWLVILDSNDDVIEDDETNNLGFGDGFTIMAPAMDLLASWVEAPEFAEPGQTVSIAWEIENLGQEDLGFEYELWLSIDSTLSDEDLRLSQTRIENLASRISTYGEQAVHLTGEAEGIWYVLLVIDSANEHPEDDENNNVRFSNNTITISADNSPPVGSILPGCDDPSTDGNFLIDAAGSRSSAQYLTSNPNMTLDGCLSGFDEADWYSFLLDAGNRTTIAFSAEGAHLEIAIMYGEDILVEEWLNNGKEWTTLAVTNEDEDEVPIRYHVRVSWDPSHSGGPYRLLFVTADENTETDVTPPPTPEFSVDNIWTSSPTILVEWSSVEDEGSGLDRYEIRWMGGLWSSVESNSSQLNLTMLADGRHALELRAVDNAGNNGSVVATWVRIDRHAVEINLEFSETVLEPNPFLIVNLSIDDGEGSGPMMVMWSTDNSTWQEFPTSGILEWQDWSQNNLFLKVTDWAGNSAFSNITFDDPTVNTEGEDSRSSTSSGISGGTMAALIIAIIITIVVVVLFALKARSQGVEDEEGEGSHHPTPIAPIVNPPSHLVPMSPIENQEQQYPPSALSSPSTMQNSIGHHVPDYRQLPPGGEYDQSSGQTEYVLPSGQRWKQRDDGSFLLQN